MAGRSELPSGNPSSLRRTELRLGEPEPPAKKRIIDVAVLVEPCQLARVSGYRASVRCSLPPAGVFSESGLGALWQAFARSLPVAGAKADAGWNGSLGRARSAAETRATHSAQLAASFDRCRDAHAAIPPGLCAIFTLCCRLCSRLLRAPSLAQECVQRSLLVLSGYAATTGIKAEKTRTESYF